MVGGFFAARLGIKIREGVVATESLPPIHKDPFDRVLVAQATVEGVTLLTIKQHAKMEIKSVDGERIHD